MTNGSYQFEKLVSQDLEIIQLRERAQLRLAEFNSLLLRHNFPPRGNILEVGCGHGIRTNHIAKHFPETSIIGVDRSPAFVKIAQETFDTTSNLSFQEADLYDLPFEDNLFDFIYVRLVFMHLPQPMNALEELKRVLRPGGRILIEDADRDAMFFEPAPSSFHSFWQCVQLGQRRLGGDPNVGRKLAVYFKSAAFQNLIIEAQPIIGTGEDIAFLVQTLMPSLNLYLEPEQRGAGDQAIADLQALSQNPNACFYHFWHAVSAAKSD